jgi:hypothetical protein
MVASAINKPPFHSFSNEKISLNLLYLEKIKIDRGHFAALFIRGNVIIFLKEDEF